ncbi:MAG: cobyrinate a,c-diamide synthase [Bacteroides sp.]|nr:cobyrinate a,c-diamide synthase [Bacteroides sp.]
MLGFVIAGVSSGSGKTTVTNGLLRGFANRGFSVAPFKVGPDYIDTQFHRVAAGVPSINLDLFMSDEICVKERFQRYAAGKDIAVVEGVMGLFDGYDKDRGSASNIARILDLPVVLVVNAASSAYSLVALLSGFKNHDERIRIAGVIFNNVASDNHLRLLKSAAEDAGVTCLGYVRRDPTISVPSRHLGLSLGDSNMMEEFVRRAELAVRAGVDFERLLEGLEFGASSLGTSGLGTSGFRPQHSLEAEGEKAAEGEIATAEGEKAAAGRIAVAWDDAFNFVYPENLRALACNHRFGGEIVRFSPLSDEQMPDADFLYLPGGYPELFAERLEANVPMRESVRQFVENGGFVMAECGGMIYLGEEINGRKMCGVLPLSASMDKARLHLGYRTMRIGDFTLRGHEFHYSSVIENKERIGSFKSCAEQLDVKGERVSTPIYRYKNTIAGYTHWYWGDNDISELYENLHA